jgi:hypothetical protein
MQTRLIDNLHYSRWHMTFFISSCVSRSSVKVVSGQLVSVIRIREDESSREYDSTYPRSSAMLYNLQTLVRRTAGIKVMIRSNVDQMRRYLAQAMRATSSLPIPLPCLSLSAAVEFLFVYKLGSLLTYYLACQLSLGLSIGSVFASELATSFPILTRAHLRYAGAVDLSDAPRLVSPFETLLPSWWSILPRDGGFKTEVQLKVRSPLCGCPFTTKLPHPKPWICHISMLCCQ